MYTLEICLLSVFPLFLSTYGTVLERAEEVVLSYDFLRLLTRLPVRHRNNQLQVIQDQQPISSLPCLICFYFLFPPERTEDYLLDEEHNVLFLCHASTTLDRDHLSHPNPACIHIHPPTHVSTPNHPHAITYIIIQLYSTSTVTFASHNWNCTWRCQRGWSWTSWSKAAEAVSSGLTCFCGGGGRIGMEFHIATGWIGGVIWWLGGQCSFSC